MLLFLLHFLINAKYKTFGQHSMFITIIFIYTFLYKKYIKNKLQY